MAEKKVLFVIAPKDFRDEELFHTKEEVEKAGFKATIASLSTNEAVGMLGGKARPEVTIDKVNADEFDAIVFVGGGGAEVYFENPIAQQLARKFYEAKKVTSAICIAPSVLANSGVLKGKKATSWPSELQNLKAKGATIASTGVSRDGKVITADGPKSAREFGKEIVKALIGN